MVHYKLIEHERLGDAPFVGALICAKECYFNCTNCINEDVKRLPTKEAAASAIVAEVKQNPFNTGIILSGLEWSEQICEAIELAKEAQKAGLKAMLYTGLKWDEISALLCESLRYFDYIKCGRYEEEKKVSNNYQHGVLLATSNQRIYKIMRKDSQYEITFTQNF